ncbi:FAD-binding domain-containing protein [Polyplosphaeria fusca]|uniref:FAD-binding domain-containing protein n=1 Tax=Polyplosphaeria fusca TaxID=682080 RepID=A0A9P4QHN8_9PLEO|nr:FAD-binding domain-containing protein [Polyplosphaeria fusca]
MIAEIVLVTLQLPIVLGLFLQTAVQYGSCSLAPSSPSSCYCFPGDACWPSKVTWSEFNHTVGEQLTATTPIAYVCHGSTYSQSECEKLQANWFYPETHIPSSSSIMAPIFTNDSCSPFRPQESPCALGNYVSYAVGIRDVADARSVIKFAVEHNLRLVVRNTGHDYNGKSTGAGSLAIWTKNLNTLEVIESYHQSWYTGRALKLGASVMVHDAYRFAQANNGIVVGGNCPTVGMAGGLIQGGGHGPLATRHGLAADQVLEWEVLLASGRRVIASPSENSELYWALCGGGPGTYGLVLSMTVKLHPLLATSAARLTFGMPAVESEVNKFWNVVKSFIQSLPEMVDEGLQVTFSLMPGAFLVTPATGAGVPQKKLDKLFQPTLKHLDKVKLPYQYDSKQFDSFLASYETMSLPSSNISNSILGGRLLPRSVAVEDVDQFLNALRTIYEANYVFAGLALDVSQTPPDKVSANPYWRKTLINGVLGTFYDYSNHEGNFKNQDYLTKVLIPLLDKLSHGESAAYVNEASFAEPDWQRVFYGENYGRLRHIKRLYDRHGMFFCLGGVGSEDWAEEEDGRLCRT